MPEITRDRCTISPDNLSKYGFAVFHHLGEANPSSDVWQRDIVINIGLEHGSRIQTFSIPKNLLIQLPVAKKIVTADNFEISRMSSALETIKLLSERAGWNQTEGDLKTMLSMSTQGTFISSYRHLGQKISLGSGISLPVSDKLSWIGMILVHPELRRQGIASAIMEICLNHARLDQQASIIGLDATPQGKKVYDSLGFKDSFSVWRSIIPTNCTDEKISTDIEAITETSLIDEYLKTLDYTERLKITHQLCKLPGSECILAKSAKQVCGFVLSRPGRIRPFVGPLIADTKEIAHDLLNRILNQWKAKGHSHIFMDIPSYHLNNSIFYTEEKTTLSKNLQIPVQPSREFIRMYQLMTEQERIKDHATDEFSQSRKAMEKSVLNYEETLNFMQKEKHDLLPFMYGTGGPEWS